MPWAGILAAVSPVGAASGDIVTYILSFGVLGVGAVIFGILTWRGWDIRSPAKQDKDRAEARADLEAAITRLNADNERLRDERDKALAKLDDLQGYIRDQYGPLMANFTTATQALLPVLQQRWEGRRAPGRRAGD